MNMALKQPQHPLLIDTVMVNVLSYLPQEDFLSARLVCPIWDVNGRHLIKNDKGRFDFCIKMIEPKSSAISINGLRFSQFNTIFEDDPDGKKMVYSKFEIPDLVFSNEFRELWPSKIPVPPLALEPSVERFFQKYGDKIKSLKLFLSNEFQEGKFQDYNCQKLENAARLMPNLETIEFGEIIYFLEAKQAHGTTGNPDPPSPQIIPAKFNNVTRMKIPDQNFNINLVNIPEYFPNIHCLSIVNRKDKMESILKKSFDYFGNSAPIPCTIESLIIENICNQDLITLCRLTNESGLKLKYFRGDLAKRDGDLFRRFYEFISLQNSSLEGLDFKIQSAYRSFKSSFPLNWAPNSIVFPKLTSLGIRGEFIQEICKGREFHKVFPSVKKIQLELPFIRKFQVTSNFGDLFPGLSDTPSKVRVLEISVNGETSRQDQFENMDIYFPNIRELSLIINSFNWDEYLTSLLGMEEWMDKIKVLKISIPKNDKFPTQIDGCLLDLIESEIIIKFVEYIGSNLEEEEKGKEIFGIAKCSNLTRLELSGPITLTDISIYLGFGRMRSLKQVVINPPAKIKLTSKCEEYIRKKGFQILINQESEIVPGLEWHDEIFDSSDEDEDFDLEIVSSEEDDGEEEVEEEEEEEDSEDEEEEDEGNSEEEDPKLYLVQ